MSAGDRPRIEFLTEGAAKLPSAAKPQPKTSFTTEDTEVTEVRTRDLFFIKFLLASLRVLRVLCGEISEVFACDANSQVWQYKEHKSMASGEAGAVATLCLEICAALANLLRQKIAPRSGP
jgi:hypothetical protein